MRIIKSLFVLGLVSYSIVTSLILVVEGVAFRYAVKAYEMVVPVKRPKGLSAEMTATLHDLEMLLGRKLTVTSGKRTGKGSSSHNTGKAVDIRAWTLQERFEIVQAANKLGLKRMGVYDRHIHLDVDHHKKQDVMWLGKSE